MSSFGLPLIALFLSTPSARRATVPCDSVCQTIEDFYPRPLRGGRLPRRFRSRAMSVFLSTPSARRATRPQEPPSSLREFLSTPSARRATFLDVVVLLLQNNFYPRPLRGGRPQLAHLLKTDLGISIHALCEEGDCNVTAYLRHNSAFLSTPSARRATQDRPRRKCDAGYFYPRPLRGGRPTGGVRPNEPETISIHALCEEGDKVPKRYVSRSGISIHALCEEGDGRDRHENPQNAISIHALCEEGDCCSDGGTGVGRLFLSTPSARRATKSFARRRRNASNFYPRPLRGGRPAQSLRRRRPSRISIHALCEEGDAGRQGGPHGNSRFLSTPSARRATRETQEVYSNVEISIHALCEEGDQWLQHLPARHLYFYPRPLRGGRPRTRSSSWSITNFYPRPLRGGRQQKQRQNLYFQTNYTTFCTNLEEL